MQLLIENCSEHVSSNLVFEDLEGGKKKRKYFLEGIFIQSNIKNRNGRMYPKSIVDKEIARYITEMVEKNRAVGELRHPSGDDPSLNYERASHKIISLRPDGDNWIGKAVVTTGTPMGRIVAGLMDDGVQMGVSSRAVGSTRLCEGGVRVVQNNFHLITAADVVEDPSAPDAFVQNLMEGKEWIWENGLLVESNLEDAKGKIDKLAKAGRLDESKLLEIFRMVLENKKI